jgi:hypothetical protein
MEAFVLRAGRRCAELCASLLALHDRLASDSVVPVEPSSSPLLVAVASLFAAMRRMLLRFGERCGGPRTRAVFLVNCAGKILAALEAIDAEASAGPRRSFGASRASEGDGAAALEDDVEAETRRFVEEELLHRFGALVRFVRRSDGAAAEAARRARGGESSAAAVAAAPVDVEALDGLVRGFAARWRDGVRGVQSDVLSLFSDPARGVDVLRRVLTQLLLYYTRLTEIVDRVYAGGPPPFAASVVSVQTIMFEIRRATRA